MERTETSRCRSRERLWAWPRERDAAPSDDARNIYPSACGECHLPDGVIPNEELRQAVLAAPEDDAPRQAYAAWFAAQEHEFARLLGAFLGAQLRVAQALRADPRADVDALRSWRGDGRSVSIRAFRAGDVFRRWFQDDVCALHQQGLVDWPQIYRGFVERVVVRAGDFPRIAESLFRLAPIRYLVVVGVAEAVDELAGCPHLARIRSLSLPRHSPADALTDNTLRRLVASPHLGQLAHLRLVHQDRLTPSAYHAVATATTLPRLSSFEVFVPRFGWEHVHATRYAASGRSERMISYDAMIPLRRSRAWIRELESALGYRPWLHPEDHYGRNLFDLEAIVEPPIGPLGNGGWS